MTLVWRGEPQRCLRRGETGRAKCKGRGATPGEAAVSRSLRPAAGESTLLRLREKRPASGVCGSGWSCSRGLPQASHWPLPPAGQSFLGVRTARGVTHAVDADVISAGRHAVRLDSGGPFPSPGRCVGSGRGLLPGLPCSAVRGHGGRRGAVWTGSGSPPPLCRMGVLWATLKKK